MILFSFVEFVFTVLFLIVFFVYAYRDTHPKNKKRRK